MDINDEDLVVAIKLIRAMCSDNGFCFCDNATLQQVKILASAVERMKVAGLEFSEEVIFNISAGEAGEVLKAYGKYDGWKELDTVLTVIFDGE